MADIELIVNPIDYDSATLTEVIGDGKQFWYKNVPGYTGYCYIVGDGVAQLQNLTFFGERASTEFSFTSSATTRFLGKIVARKSATDSVRIELTFEEVVDQDADTITLTSPGTFFRVYDGSGNYNTITSPTFGTPVVTGKTVLVTMSETDIAAGLVDSQLGFMVSGGGGGFTLS